jgi:hypothetical protein
VANPTSPQGSGLTPAKGAIIAVLAVVLVGVLYMQFSGGAGTEVSESSAYKPPKTTPRPPRPGAANSAKQQAETVAKDTTGVKPELVAFDPTRWETPELSRVTAFDPFARPTTFPQPKIVAEGEADAAANAANAEDRARQLAEAVEKAQTQLEQLQQRGVQVIVGGGDQGGYVAVIGDRTVHVGDTINGFVVTAIEPDGVQVEQQSEVE